jgi:hypothetical protein
LATSIRTLPFRPSSPASSRASSETAPAVVLTTISPWAAASAKVPIPTSGCFSCQAPNGGCRRLFLACFDAYAYTRPLRM